MSTPTITEATGITWIETLYIQLLYRCQFRCSHCFHGDRLAWRDAYTLDQAITLVELMRRDYGTTGVNLLGGEPFLFYELGPLLAHTKRTLGMHTEICTNGYRINRKLAEVASDLDLLRVSLEGLEQANDAIRHPGSFREAIAALTYARDLGITTGVTMTVTATRIADAVPLARLLQALAVPDTDSPLVFVALEGLRGSGKSTIAPLLARAIGAEHVATFPAEYAEARAFLDWRSHDPEARAHLFVSALLITAERVKALMEVGSSVVIDSFTQRTVATHRAFGAAMDLILPKDLPSPITFRLECSADERQTRLRGRDKLTTWWDELADDLADRIEQEYAAFPAHRINTTHQQPEETVQAILEVLRARSC